MSKPSIASAYVQILPTTEGIKGKLTEALNGPMKDVGQRAGRNLGSALGKGLLTGVKIGGAAITAASSAVGALVNQSVEGFADREQLVGGVEKLFGDAGEAVQRNAAAAFKTAGFNANEYMETVTSFSASLISGLEGDTAEAARVADIAMRDIADNANTFGKYSAQDLTAVYQNLAKGQFQMLDNLSLGYNGSASEMARLINESGVLDGAFKATAENVKDIPFDIMIQAIHAVQDEMGIAGTTAKEAMFTVSGSVGAAKAAWSNLITGLADDNADLEGLIDSFLETIIGVNGEGGVINNILPAAEKALNGISKLIEAGVPTLIPLAVDILTQNFPQLSQAGAQILVALITGLAVAFPDLIRSIPMIVKTFVTGLKDSWPEIKAAGAELLQVVGDGLKSAGNSAKSWGSDLIQLFINGIRERAAALLDEVKSLAGGIADYLHFSVPEKGPLSDLDESPRDMMEMYASGIRSNRHLLTDALDSSLQFTAPAISANAAAPSQGMAQGGNVFNISVNVDGAETKDDRELAQRIAYEIKSMFDREAAAIA